MYIHPPTALNSSVLSSYLVSPAILMLYHHPGSWTSTAGNNKSKLPAPTSATPGSEKRTKMRVSTPVNVKAFSVSIATTRKSVIRLIANFIASLVVLYIYASRSQILEPWDYMIISGWSYMLHSICGLLNGIKVKVCGEQSHVKG